MTAHPEGTPPPPRVVLAERGGVTRTLFALDGCGWIDQDGVRWDDDELERLNVTEVDLLARADETAEALAKAWDEVRHEWLGQGGPMTPTLHARRALDRLRTHLATPGVPEEPEDPAVRVTLVRHHWNSPEVWVRNDGRWWALGSSLASETWADLCALGTVTVTGGEG